MEYQPILVRERTTIGQRANHYWSENEPLLVRSRTNSGSYHHLRGTLSYSSTGALHPPTTKRDTPPTQTKNTAKRQPS